MENKFIELKCPNCGSVLEKKSSQMFVCPACATTRIIPTAELEIKISRADLELSLGDFEKAELLFSDIVNEEPNVSDGYWGLLRCKYGLNLVKEATGKEVITCSKTSIESFVKDSLYLKALKYAENDDVRRKYEEMGVKIEQIRQEWVEKASKEKPYDIFISYKESYLDENGNQRRTQDSIDAFELYTHLTNKGYKVFYSRESLRDHTAEIYEPYIFSALNSAKVMILYGQKREYLEATWVKNEWSRFLKKIETGEKKKGSLVVCYEKMNTTDLPQRFQNTQALDASRKTFLTDLISYIERQMKLYESEKKVSKISFGQQVKRTNNVNSAIKLKTIDNNVTRSVSVTTESKLQTAYQLLKRGLYAKALQAYKLILVEDSENQQARYGYFMAKNHCSTINQINISQTIDELPSIVTGLNKNEALELIAAATNELEKVLSTNNVELISKIFAFVIEYDTPSRSKAISLIVDYIDTTSNNSVAVKLIKALPQDDIDIKLKLSLSNAKKKLKDRKFKDALKIAQYCNELDEASAESLWINLYCKNKAATDLELSTALAKCNNLEDFEDILRVTPEEQRDSEVCKIINILLLDWTKPNLIIKKKKHCDYAIRYFQSQSLARTYLNKIGYALLEQGLYEQAKNEFETSVLEEANIEGYLGIVCSNAKVKKFESLEDCDYEFINDIAYQKAIELSTDEKKQELYNLAFNQDDRKGRLTLKKFNKCVKFNNFILFFFLPLLVLLNVLIKHINDSVYAGNAALIMIAALILVFVIYIFNPGKDLYKKMLNKAVFFYGISIITLLSVYYYNSNIFGYVFNTGFMQSDLSKVSYEYMPLEILNNFLLSFKSTYTTLINVLFIISLVLMVINSFLNRVIIRKGYVITIIKVIFKLAFALFIFLSIEFFALPVVTLCNYTLKGKFDPTCNLISVIIVLVSQFIVLLSTKTSFIDYCRKNKAIRASKGNR